MKNEHKDEENDQSVETTSSTSEAACEAMATPTGSESATTTPSTTSPTASVPTTSAPVAATQTGPQTNTHEPVKSGTMSSLRPQVQIYPLMRGPSANRILEAETEGEAVTLLRQVEQLDSLINANATLKSVNTSSARRPSRSHKQILGYLEKNARSALSSEVEGSVGANPDASSSSIGSGSGVASPKHSNSRKIFPQVESKLETIGSGDLSDVGEIRNADSSMRRKSSFFERNNLNTLGLPLLHGINEQHASLLFKHRLFSLSNLLSMGIHHGFSAIIIATQRK